MTALRPIAALARTISPACHHRRPTRHEVAEGSLFVAGRPMATVDLVDHGMALIAAGARGWRFGHDPSGAPLLHSDDDPALAASIAATGRERVLLLGTGPIGVDAETLDRIAANAAADDPWLSTGEQALLAGLSAADRVLELACRWVLREAYGKASGRGLDLPLARFGFTVCGDAIALPPSLVPDRSWSFSLHRRGDLVLGIVAARSGG